MRRFHLHRDNDGSTVVAAEGVLFESGKIVISWLTGYPSLSTYDSMEILMNANGHGGNTRVVFEQESSDAPKLLSVLTKAQMDLSVALLEDEPNWDEIHAVERYLAAELSITPTSGDAGA